jgi:hypothetical protein
MKGKMEESTTPNERYCVGFCMIKIGSKEKNINH